MVFLGIYRAIYDYVPQSEGEIALAEGDLLMVLEKSTDDDWWKAKKKGSDEDEEEPEGLIPNNYIEEVSCIRPPTVPPLGCISPHFFGTPYMQSGHTLQDSSC